MANHPETRHISEEPPPLTQEFHKARKQLMLWSGILFAWELIGIDLLAIKEAKTDYSVVFKALKSPQAVPYVLVALVCYFSYRLYIEWYQAHPDRRAKKISRIDITVSYSLATISLLLYGIQSIANIQIANYVSEFQFYHFFICGIIIILLIKTSYIFRTKRPLWRIVIYSTLISVFIIVMIVSGIRILSVMLLTGFILFPPLFIELSPYALRLLRTWKK